MSITLHYDFLNDLVEITYLLEDGSTHVAYCSIHEIGRVIQECFDKGLEYLTVSSENIRFSSEE